MKYGILGLGSIGRRHASNLITIGKKVLAYDPQEASKDYAKKKNIRMLPRAQVLKECEAVLICSPNRYHLQDMKDAVDAGCHCFVEKPISHQIEGVEDVLLLAERKNLIVFVGLNLRFHPAVKLAKEILDHLKIGEVNWAIFQSSHYLPDWRPGQDYRDGYTSDSQTGGVIFDIIHEIDLASLLLGPGEVKFATAKNSGLLEINSEDCADIFIGHQNNIISTIHLDYITKPSRRWFSIGGSLGTLDVDLISRKLQLVSSDGKQAIDRNFNDTNDADDYLAEIESFVFCAENRKMPTSDAKSALVSLEQVISARNICGLPRS